MTDLTRIRAQWSGFGGGPGVSTFYSLGSGLTVANLRAWFLAIAQYLPNTVTVQVENSGDVVDDVTGALVGAWAVSPVLPVVGVVGGSYSAPSGWITEWLTTTILDGHRLVGKTFCVPSAGSVLDGDGTLANTPITNLRAYTATAFAAMSGDLCVWHRPRVARAATAYHPAVTARDGGHGLVTGYRIPDKVVVLRSRRD